MNLINFGFILASGGEKDLLETIFFVVIALISVLGPIFNKFLKKSEPADESEITVDGSIFGEIEEETPEPTPDMTVDYSRTSAYDEKLRKRREQTHLAQTRNTEDALKRFNQKETFGNTGSLRTKPPRVPVPTQRPAAPRILENKGGNEIFESREALRRAVLAQEILSPPLALRDE